MLWTDPHSLRIWRDSFSNFNGDEVIDAPRRYHDDALARISAEGFTGIWLGAQLYDLMHSRVFPSLNRPRADERLAAIQAVIDRAAKHGLGVYLYFNDPVSLPVAHPFWNDHADLKGVTLWNTFALCTSTPEVQAYFADAVESAMAPLRNLGGVFLITACESLTHCWSKTRLRMGAPPPTCPRCRVREPADLVLELIETWSRVRRAHPTPFRLLAWNWEWAYWYADPQREIIDRLPADVELLLDMELGGVKRWNGRDIPIGEYALSFTGPSQRFLASHTIVRGKRPIHAKIQINNTHELASVPNIPVPTVLHGKFSAMSRLGIAGFLGTWSFGSRFTLNTFAMKLFMSEPTRFMDENEFLRELAQRYLGVTDAGARARVIEAWRGFAKAWSEYPFAVPMLYNGPCNDAPARPLSLRFEGKPTGRSWCMDPPGDDWTNAIAGFTADEVVAAFERMRDGWLAALPGYEAALNTDEAAADEAFRGHRREELATARAIGVILTSCVNIIAFWREQKRVIAELGLQPPCDVPATPVMLQITRDEIAHVRGALPLVESDERLGRHDDVQDYKFSAVKMRAKIEAMEAEWRARE